ncbi:MAG: tetratricopeptide repeat protein [Planctomycetes bacterium]|nr:tetratricopeptide repeat protein [Planctomycetota bacterium]
MNQVSAEHAYLFTHAVYREVAYQLHLPSERQRLHGLALDVIETQFPNDLARLALDLSAHARQARGESDDPAQKQREAKYLELVVRNSRRGGVQQAGIECGRRLIALGVLAPAELMAAHQSLRELFSDLGRRAEALAAGSAAYQFSVETGHFAKQVEIACDLAHMELLAGAVDSSNVWCARAEAAIHPTSTPIERATLHNLKATLLEQQGRQPEAEAEYRKAIALLEQTYDRSVARNFRGNLANHLGATGRRREALQLLGELTDDFRAENDQRGLGVLLSNQARQLLALGDYAKAETACQQAIEIMRGLGVRRSEAFGLASLSEIWRQLGRLDQSEQAALAALEIAREVGQPIYSAAYLATHAGLLLLTGRETEAQQRLQQSRIEFETGGGGQYVPEYCDVWRLRVAASLACSMDAPGKGTSRLAACAPAPRWVAAARLILAGMETALQQKKATGDLAVATKSAREVLAELEAAIKEKRPALLFRGHRPQELTPALRAALLQRLEVRQPGALQALGKSNPALLQAMTADSTGAG